jgi:hypothetical protein
VLPAQKKLWTRKLVDLLDTYKVEMQIRESFIVRFCSYIS